AQVRAAVVEVLARRLADAYVEIDVTAAAGLEAVGAGRQLRGRDAAVLVGGQAAALAEAGPARVDRPRRVAAGNEGVVVLAGDDDDLGRVDLGEDLLVGA